MHSVPHAKKLTYSPLSLPHVAETETQRKKLRTKKPVNASQKSVVLKQLVLVLVSTAGLVPRQWFLQTLMQPCMFVGEVNYAAHLFDLIYFRLQFLIDDTSPVVSHVHGLSVFI